MEQGLDTNDQMSFQENSVSMGQAEAPPMGMTTVAKETNESASKAVVAEDDFVDIPDRIYFRIGDVAEITGIKPYVLRFWEKEFSFLSPVKNDSGQRIYRKSDVESVLLVKRLLYKERYSIEGAKRRIQELRKKAKLGAAKRVRGELNEKKLLTIKEVRSSLSELIELCK